METFFTLVPHGQDGQSFPGQLPPQFEEVVFNPSFIIVPAEAYATKKAKRAMKKAFIFLVVVCVFVVCRCKPDVNGWKS